MKTMLAVAAMALCSSSAFGWDGADAETGGGIEIGSGNLVSRGREIEIYDHGAGEYRSVTVEHVSRKGPTIEVEVYDGKVGEYRVLEMKD